MIVGGVGSSLIWFRGPLIDTKQAAGHQVTCSTGESKAVRDAEEQLRGIAFHSLVLERAGITLLAHLRAVHDIIGLRRRVRPNLIFVQTDKSAFNSCFASRSTGIGRPYLMMTVLGYALTPDRAAGRFGAIAGRWLASAVLWYTSRAFIYDTDDRQFYEARRLTRLGWRSSKR